MELEWETRPTVAHQERDWSSGSTATSAFSSKSTAQRRRSSIVHAPPALPPPSQPIPSVPVLQAPSYDEYERDSHYGAEASTSEHGSELSNPYARPHASAGLAAVAAFSQARHRSSSNTSQMSSASSSASLSAADNLSDSPPPSMLRSTLSVRHREDALPDTTLLKPPESSGGNSSRPSSRRALTKALELAREAVKLDSSNDDPYGAIVAYGQSVALLQEVMGRVMRGEDSTESHRRRNGRRRSVVAQEEEVRRLKSIHDTYADRMNILSLIYSIPAPSQSPTSLYRSVSPSTSAGSTQPPSPDSNSPSSDSSDHNLRIASRASDDPRHIDYSEGDYNTNGDDSDIGDDVDALGAAIFTFDTSRSPGLSSPTRLHAASSHPYAFAHPVANPYSPTSATPSINISRSPDVPPSRPVPTAPMPGRPRASSALPPPAPPPIQSPPPAPIDLADGEHAAALYNKHLDVSRPRGSTTSHRRTPSGRLVVVGEDNRDASARPHQQYGSESRLRSGSQPVSRQRESHPLPPLPPPSQNSSPLTPRFPVGRPDSPHLSMLNQSRVGSSLSVHSDVSATTPTPRARAESITSDASGSESSSMQPLISASTTMGTISQRRSKMSAPPSATGSSVPPPVPGATPNAVPKFPANTAASLSITGRSRSSSQPGRRPSLVGTQIIDYNGHPPVPASANIQGMNGAPRKVSIPSKLNPAMQPLSINTGLFSPPLPVLPASALSLVPPPPIPHANLPTTPTSPLPPLAPNDALRKPYHLMNLLRQAMLSKSGGYITRRLHVPQEVWSQGGVKLANLAEKVRVVEVLCSALEDVEKCSAEVFGAGNVSSGMGLGIGSVGRKEGEAWSAKLEEFTSVCDSVVTNFGKKLGVGEGFALQKKSGVTSWGGKLTRQFDKFTAGKNLDSPTAYTQGLCRLFSQAQLLDEHTKAISSQPIAPTYAALPADIRGSLEVKLKHASEFFARVVLTFVIRDLSLLLDKYAKKCEKWLAE